MPKGFASAFTLDLLVWMRWVDSLREFDRLSFSIPNASSPDDLLYHKVVLCEMCAFYKVLLTDCLFKSKATVPRPNPNIFSVKSRVGNSCCRSAVIEIRELAPYVTSPCHAATDVRDERSCLF
ncbi:hypothetical protein TNIN_499081 [Trichonephila inaurata madagascariensis]|uniref:Uncharacterized protein n=1 Tax=Trichonephila inaurata madagascariensis TaxID=2747483 RepID=A0A8X6WPX0_9ARAC|nr:hypothetical protein TNIN_499081 [Trichonephila inaurata madagascariensis]